VGEVTAADEAIVPQPLRTTIKPMPRRLRSYRIFDKALGSKREWS
jgi:hypothetical protein